MDNKTERSENQFHRALVHSFVLRGERKAYLNTIRRLEWATEEEISAYQEEQLAQVLSDARKNIPYYRDHATGDSLSDFPVLTRNEIKAYREELIAADRIDKKTLLDTTSGTTSVPVSFLLDWGHRERGAMQKVFFNEWAGLPLGDRMIKFWGVFPAKSWKGRLRNAISHRMRNMTLLNCLDMRAEQMDRFAESIEQLQPRMILAYANSMTEFARYLDRKGRVVNYSGTIMSSTSSLTPEKRAVMEKVFGCPVFDRYGSREMIDFACDCQHHEGLHVSPYMHVVEILDEEGNPCPPGKSGRVVVTQLFNPVMPLIRYDLGDYATWAEHKCSCGRNWPLLKAVDGRAISVFKRRDGGRFSSYFCVHTVNQVVGQKRILRQQIVQEAYNRFTVRLVLQEPEKWTEREIHQRQLEARIGELIGEPVQIGFDVVAEIPNQASGKYLQSICMIQEEDGCV